MWRRVAVPGSVTVLVVVTLLLLGSGVPAGADVSPAGCTDNVFVLNIGKSANAVHIGDTITYTVATGNPNTTGAGCDVFLNSVVGTRPNGTTATLAACAAAYPITTPVASCGTFTYVVSGADVVSGAVTASVAATGCLRDTNSGSCAGTLNDPLTFLKTVTVTIEEPGIHVAKTCTNEVFGTPIPFSGSVTNNGNTGLTGVTCTDNIVGPLTLTGLGTGGTLAIGASATYSGSYTPTTNPSTDTVTCTGSDSLGRSVTNTASATCAVLCSPALSVTKACTVNNQPPGQPVTVGGSVTNSGNVPLTGVTCTDSITGTVTPSSTTLAAGGSATYSKSYTPTQQSTTDTISCTGTPPAICGGGTVPSNTATATCTVACAPTISVAKSCTDATAPAGIIAFSGTVTNTGNTPLTGLTCSDTTAGGTASVTPSSTSLSTPNGQATYSGSYTGTPGPNTDTVNCTASVPAVCGGGTVSGQASKTCNVPSPPGITTLPNPSSGGIGIALNDSATLTGTVNPGTVTFTLFGPTDSTCQGSPVFTATVPVSGPGTVSTTDAGAVISGSNIATVAGLWHWTAVLNGTTAITSCTEPVTITGVPIPTLSEWGMLLIVMLLVGSAFEVLRRRRVV